MGFLSGLFDDGSKQARKLNIQNMDWIKGLYGGLGSTDPNTIFGALSASHKAATPYMSQAIGAARSGREDALQALSGAGAQAYQTIADQSQRAAAAARQGAVSRGLYSSTGGIQAENQARYQAQRAAGQMGVGLGQQAAGVHMAGSGREMSALQQLAAMHLQKGQLQAQMGAGLGGAMGQFQFQPGKSLMDQMAPILGAAAGAL